MRRGLTQAALAEMLGISDRMLRKHETIPTSAELAPELANILDFPPVFFVKEDAPEIEANAVNFRAGRSTTKRQRDAALSVGSAGIELSHWIVDRFSLPDVDVPDLQDEFPQVAAALVRELWGLGTKPLPNLVQLCESRGIRVLGLPGAAASVDAYSTWEDGIPFIFLACTKSFERTRFDLAHELGHLVLHRRGQESETVSEEKEANAFASAFLLPSESVVEYLPSNPVVDDILRLKNAFVVSAMAMTMAARNAGRLSEWGYRNACITLSQRGYRKGEPDGRPGYERSRLFQQLLDSTKVGKVSAQRIADELSLPVKDVRTLMLQSELAAVESVPALFGPVEESPQERPQLRVIG